MNAITKITTRGCAVALASLVALSPVAVHAGRGATEGSIRSAINSGNADAIVSELERAENIPCASTCMSMVMGLVSSDEYRVREAAAWWFARRPAQKEELSQTSTAWLATGDAIAVRNGADVLGTFGYARSIPALQSALGRNGVTPEAKVAVVRALGRIGNTDANAAIESAMSDSAAVVRRQAVVAWRDMRGQTSAGPVVALIGDDDASVARVAIATVGHLREASARQQLETVLATSKIATVRRNAAWALGRLGDAKARPALEAASNDPSGLVRLTAKSAMRELR